MRAERKRRIRSETDIVNPVAEREMPLCYAEKIACAVQNPFRRAGGTRRIHQKRRLSVVRGIFKRFILFYIFKKAAVHGQRGFAVGFYKAYSVFRVLGHYRNNGAPCCEHTEIRRDIFHAASHIYYDERAFFNTETVKFSRNLPGKELQLRVSRMTCPTDVDHCSLISIQSY